MPHIVALLAAFLLPISCALAQSDAADAPNLITDNAAVLFVRLDLAKLDLAHVETLLKARLSEPELDSHPRAAVERWARALVSRLERLKQAGVQDLYLIGSLEFLEFDLGPLLESPQDFVYFVIPHNGRIDSVTIAKAFGVELSLPNDKLRPNSDRERRWLAIETDLGGDRQFTLVGPTRLLARVVRDRAKPRAEVVAALQSETPLQIALVPPPIFGRAFSEIIGPAIGNPEAIKALSALRSVSLGIDPKPDGQWRFTVHAHDNTGAASIEALLEALPKAAPQLTKQTPLLSLAMLLNTLELASDGAQVIAQGCLNESGSVEKALRTALSDGLLAVARQQTAQKMREIVIAINNHIDSYKTLPMTAGFSTKDGKPLLSWRVKLLPYLDQWDLYHAFHKDEPWDSEHNKQLIDRMPRVYRRPFGDPKSTTTPFLLPVEKQTAYPGGKELTMAQMRDGVSQTIALLSLQPAHEVTWTKPEDWEINIDDPTNALQLFDDKAVVGFIDAKILFLPKSAPKDQWKALFTPDGGEPRPRELLGR